MSNENTICPICDEGALSPSTYVGELEYEGEKIAIPGLERSVCDSCGATPILPEQVRRNDLRYTDAKRSHDGLLTSEQIRYIRNALSLTQQQASLLFGGGSNAFSKYERGEVVQSVSMDRLLRLTAHIPELLGYLYYYSGISVPSTHYGDYGHTSRISMSGSAEYPIKTGRLLCQGVVTVGEWSKGRAA